MTHAGLLKRLTQFRKGIEENKHHSAAMRFFRTVADGTPYLQLRPRMTFYFASICVPCQMKKPDRSPIDLRKMGEVAKCEYIVLAHIKEKLEREPKLKWQVFKNSRIDACPSASVSDIRSI
jgi:hypothetical protein